MVSVPFRQDDNTVNDGMEEDVWWEMTQEEQGRRARARSSRTC